MVIFTNNEPSKKFSRNDRGCLTSQSEEDDGVAILLTLNIVFPMLLVESVLRRANAVIPLEILAMQFSQELGLFQSRTISSDRQLCSLFSLSHSGTGLSAWVKPFIAPALRWM
jgi:hypothetical protein